MGAEQDIYLDSTRLHRRRCGRRHRSALPEHCVAAASGPDGHVATPVFLHRSQKLLGERLRQLHLVAAGGVAEVDVRGEVLAYARPRRQATTAEAAAEAAYEATAFVNAEAAAANATKTAAKYSPFHTIVVVVVVVVVSESLQRKRHRGSAAVRRWAPQLVNVGPAEQPL
jgi:hypothetical protein